MTAPAPVDVINIESLVGLFGPTVAAIALILTIAWRMNGKIEDAKATGQEAAKSATEKVHKIEKELADFKLKVAEEYASWETVKSIESRLTERMDVISDQVMQLPDVVVDRIMKFLNFKQPG
ncbi:hypothetical protein [Bradyrhizobium sp. SZCCHNRI2010]|uniref:hypothetical protein n=1 Tax=Bradyrhizobium sp. SZCCHNRI2010 TaxID=3057283 RepID=UPI0028EA75AC|nr:hypothetical protein [Bradyrhizobium sp. SZCCHNRI2010]